MYKRNKNRHINRDKPLDFSIEDIHQRTEDLAHYVCEGNFMKFTQLAILSKQVFSKTKDLGVPPTPQKIAEIFLSGNTRKMTDIVVTIAQGCAVHKEKEKALALIESALKSPLSLENKTHRTNLFKHHRSNLEKLETCKSDLLIKMSLDYGYDHKPAAFEHY